MDTKRRLCANGVQGGESKTDHADPSSNRTPPTIYFFFLDASNYAEKAVPKQSSDWSFIDRLIDHSCSNLLLHVRRHGWPEARSVMSQAPQTAA